MDSRTATIAIWYYFAFCRCATALLSLSICLVRLRVEAAKLGLLREKTKRLAETLKKILQNEPWIVPAALPAEQRTRAGRFIFPHGIHKATYFC